MTAKVLLVQKKTGHEPDTWEDIRIPTEDANQGLAKVAYTFRDLEQAGEHRAFLIDGSLHYFRAYPITKWVVTVDGTVQPGL